MNPFYACMKLITSEEVLSEVMPQEEHDTEFFILSNPIVITESNTVDVEKGISMSALSPRKWMMYSNEDLMILYKQHVVSISEMDQFGVEFYQKALIAARCSSPIKRKVDSKKHTGYLGKIDQLRKKLKDTFDNSPDLTTES